MLRITNLTSSYGNAPVLHHVSLQVRAGQICVILGPNGAGKTTLLRSIMGLVPVISPGSITGLDGQSFDRLAAHTIARLGVAYVPEGRGILNSLTVLENFQLGAALLRKRNRLADVPAQFSRVLERFPALKGRLGVSAGLLSGGQQQMLAIARALLPQPQILLLDEPSLGLAPMVRRDIANVLRDIADSEQVAVLLAEQDITLAQRCADEAYVLRQGRVVTQMSGSELHDHERLRRLYLGVAEPRVQADADAT